MKSLALAILLIPGAAIAGPWYELVNGTLSVTGVIGVSASSTTPKNYALLINGTSGYIQYPDGTKQTTAGGGGGDNLGNHIATKNVTANYGITTTSITATQVILNGGNVGIGTTSPNTKLHIKGATPVVRLEDSDQSSPAVPWDVEVSGSDFFIKEQANGRTVFKGTSSGPTSIYSAGTEHLYIDSYGKIGMGTNNPFWGDTSATGLHISGNNQFVGLYLDNTGSTGVRYLIASSTEASSSALLYIAAPYNIGPIMELNGGNGNAWFTANVSALSYTDRTPYPDTKEQAYAAVLSMEKKATGGVDHEKLDPYIQAWKTEKIEDGNAKGAKMYREVKTLEGRDLSATVSAQNEVIKDLIKRIEALEKK